MNPYPSEPLNNLHRIYLMPLKPDRHEDTEGFVVWNTHFSEVGVSYKDIESRLHFYPWHRIDQIDWVRLEDLDDDEEIIGTVGK